MAKRFIIGLLISFSAITFVAGQSLPDQLKQQLAGKQTLAEIMGVVDPFYLNLTEAQRNGADGLVKYRHWKRWEWYMSRRLGPHAEFVNIQQMNMLAMANDDTPKHGSSRNSMIAGSWTSLGLKKSSYSADTLNGGNNTYAKGSGRVDRIAFHPTDPNIIYIGAPNGGLWRTNDGGTHWECLTDTLPSIGISGIVVTPSSPNTLYILTGSGDLTNANYFINLFGLSAPCNGVYKSTNAGMTWTKTDTFPHSPGVFNYTGSDLVQNPTNANVLMAATSDGIFRTTNAGGTWTKVRPGLFFDLQYKPGSSTTIYAAKKDSIFYSTNDGVSWTAGTLNVAPNPASIRIALGVSPNRPNRVYAFFGKAGTNNFSGIYRSDNSGVSFTKKATTPNICGYFINGMDNVDQADYDLAIAVDPANGNKLFLSSINIWKSLDSAATCVNVTGWYENQGGPSFIHSDQHAIVYNPLNNKLYACSDGGIYVSTDSGVTWTSLTDGLVISQCYHLAQYENVSYKLVGGLQDNGIKYRNTGSEDFIHMYGADGFSTSFIENDSNTFYVTINSGVNRMKFSDGSIVGITPSGDMQFYKEVLAHPTVPNLVFCGSNVIYRSTNNGANWTNVGASGIWGMKISHLSPARMYAAGGSSAFPGAGAMYTSSDTGKTWTLISSNPGFPANYNTVTDIAIDPLNAANVYFTVGGFIAGSKIYKSTNFGGTWTNISSGLPNSPANSLVITDDAIYVGTDISVYYRLKSGGTWTNIGENIPHCPVTQLLVDQDIGTLTAATFGRGVWQRNYCIEDIDLTYPLAGKLEYKCNDQLTSSSLITGTTNDTISFKAGGKIKLLPGFKAGVGTYFTTKKEPCDNGTIPLIQPAPAAVLPSQGKVEKGKKN
ncbi:MAG: 3-coathanger stack domain-containing protein [Saprospiraceae bacterium]